MDHAASSPRRLDPADFAPEQVQAWCVAGGQGNAHPEDGSATGSDVSKWLVAYTNPRREADVVRTVERRAFEAYVPAMTVTHRRQTVERPVFPRYVFVGLRPGQEAYGLRETPGLEGLVRFDGKPVTVGHGLIERLHAEECGGVFDFTEARLAEIAATKAEAADLARIALLKPGRPVRMVGGTWANFTGRVIEHLPGRRVLVSMTLFRRRMSVPIPLAHVALVT